MTSEKCFECEGELTKTCLSCNTRAVPDVPELVRYDPNNKTYPYFEMEESELGDYIRYDQAAAIIAAERMKLEATAKAGLKLSEELESVKAELAQIKEQEPVGQNCIISVQNHLSGAGYKIPLKHIDDAIAKHYSAPVDQTAEIEGLRDVAKKVIARWDSPHWKVTAPTADVMNELRAALSGKEPS